MPVGPCIPVGIQLYRAEVGPTSGPTWRLSHLALRLELDQRGLLVAEAKAHLPDVLPHLRRAGDLAQGESVILHCH